jgi:hypothetical protein
MDRLPLTLTMDPGLDTLYAKTLSRSQHLPHFPDVISTMAFLVEPLPIVGIAELLGIESFEVVRVLVNLQAIIHVPGTDDLPVTMCHTSLRDFLTTENRSGCFFTPPSYHLYLLYRCFTFHDGRETNTAAALYGIGNFAHHLTQLARLPPTAQGPLPRFPQTLDTFYTHILARPQVHPHFSDIIPIIALHKPLPVARISELLGIETFEVVRVISSLRPIFNIPETDDSPITLCHISVHQFLANQSQTRHLFVPPYRLWPYQHIFAFALFFPGIFQVSQHKPRQILPILIKCIESLALALEQDHATDPWLQLEFDELMHNSRLTVGTVGIGGLNQAEIRAMQHNVQHVEAALGAKVLLHFPFGPFYLIQSL